jgi:RNA 2',3'-cyclic 3'-phosphodiesterase
MAEQRAQQLRLFVACQLPDEVRDALSRAQDGLRRLVPGRLRWVRPEGIHVTLKFLGDVDETRVEAIRAALAAAIDPFELRVRPATIGTFGGARVRVVWVGLKGEIEGLAALAVRVEQALAPLGFPRERRPFAAHLTLARVPDRASAGERKRLLAAVKDFRPPAFPSMMITEVKLIRSILGQGGSDYQEVASFPRQT